MGAVPHAGVKPLHPVLSTPFGCYSTAGELMAIASGEESVRSPSLTDSKYQSELSDDRIANEIHITTQAEVCGILNDTD